MHFGALHKSKLKSPTEYLNNVATAGGFSGEQILRFDDEEEVGGSYWIDSRRFVEQSGADEEKRDVIFKAIGILWTTFLTGLWPTNHLKRRCSQHTFSFQ